jgi:aspartate-semialdehyde dehydrogenase
LAKAAPAVRLAIVGGDSLLGRELRDSLSNQRLAAQVDLVADSAGESVLTEKDDEAVAMATLKRDSLAGARVIFLAGSAPSAHAVKRMELDAVLIDLTGSLDGSLRAPAAEPEHFLGPESTTIRIAHPGAIALAVFFRRLAKFAPVSQAVVNLFEPASQRGQAAIEELQEQTVGLLSFKNYPTKVFDEQLSFAMLPRFGPEAEPPLDRAESILRSDLAALLGLDECAPAPALRLVQAPVFHAYTASVWVRFTRPVKTADLEAAFRGVSWEVRENDQGPPTNTGVAGQSGITLDAIREDPGDPRAAWFWLAADNLRLAADNALLAAAAIIEASLRRVQ